MELKQYAALLWRWSWLIVLCTLLAGAVAYWASLRSVPIYEASTTILINQAPASSASPDYNSLLTSERLAKTYAELLRTRPVLEEVVANLGLELSPDDLAEKSRVSPIRDTQLIALTVSDPDPQRAAAIANEMVAVFAEQNRELQEGRYAASKESLQQELAKVQENIDSAQADLDELGTPRTAEQRAEQDRLEALLAQYRSSYATLLKSYEDVRLAEAQTTDNVSVVESARPPSTPVSPKPLRNTLLAAIVGAMIAVGIAFLVEYLDDSVKSSDEVEALVHLPTLGTITRIEGKSLLDKVIAGNSRSPAAEAYRVLRANIEFASVDTPVRSIVVTGTGPSEGKSTTVANLAIAMAQAGKRVILVDTDLRRPVLHKLFRRSNGRGVTTALLQKGPVTDHLTSTNIQNLALLPSGPLPPNPAELLGSKRMAELIKSLESHADLVLFDSPPLLAVADTPLLASACDAAILVVLTGSTRSQALQSAAEQLFQSGTRLLGTVLNRVPMKGGGYYYYYYYGANGTEPKGLRRLLRHLPFVAHKNGRLEATELVEPAAGRKGSGD